MGGSKLKASELIVKLQQLSKDHGDLDCTFLDDNYADVSIQDPYFAEPNNTLPRRGETPIFRLGV